VNVNGAFRIVGLSLGRTTSQDETLGWMPIAFDSVGLRAVCIDYPRFYLYLYEFKSRRLTRLPALGPIPQHLADGINSTQVTHAMFMSNGNLLVSFVKFPLSDNEKAVYRLFELKPSGRGHSWRYLGPYAILASTLDGRKLIIRHQRSADETWLVTVK
jgi:hypothetical protein